jgi:hypothetical protein
MVPTSVSLNVSAYVLVCVGGCVVQQEVKVKDMKRVPEQFSLS